MDKCVRINIEWLKSHVKLEEIPTNGIRFCPQIKFEEEGEEIPQWTAEIIIRRKIDESLYFGDLRYLFENAPKHFLRKGKRFIIFDGPLPIANGEVVTDLID